MMLLWGYEPRRTGRTVLIALAVAVGLSACSWTEPFTGSPAGSTSASGSSGSFTDRVTRLFGGGQSSQPAQQVSTGPSPDTDCPPVTVREGASTLMVGPPKVQPDATNLRYQVTFGQMARECAVLGATMTIKVGVQGRVILGPTGGPGNIEVPLRLALVQEGPQPKTIWTKFYKVPVTIPPGQTSLTFIHVEEDVTFPTPKGDDIDAYVVYVGFDPNAQPEKPAKKGRAPPKPKSAAAK
jgi:hypothetical protein